MFRRRRAASRGTPDAAAIVADIRRTIGRLDEERRRAATAAGRALVSQAEVKRACDEQLRALAAAFGEAEHAEVMARRAADGARRDADGASGSVGGCGAEGPDSDLTAFEQTAAGLRTVQDALDAAAEPIHALLAGARDNVEHSQRVLARARQIFDEQVREQVRLLGALERAEQQRIAREFRTR